MQSAIISPLLLRELPKNLLKMHLVSSLASILHFLIISHLKYNNKKIN